MNVIKVYRTVKRVEESHYGKKFFIDVVAEKHIKETGETWYYDNGYTQDKQPVRIDYQGRKYKGAQEIDYWAHRYYICNDVTGSHVFNTVLPRYSRDLNGNSLTVITPAVSDA